ncbi:MAG: RsmB/NOP family class I SAM-dependent RNA methyltransferase [Candidatus Nanopelagicales bacterium]
MASSGSRRPVGGHGRRRSARGAAYDLLHAVHVDDAYANIAMAEILAKAGLDSRDAGFATELAYGTLRMQGLYDAVLAECVDRPLGELDGRLHDVLRLGAHQILSMRVPAHAAVGETVALARDVVGEGPAKLANAVLRRVADGGDLDAWTLRLAPGDDAEALSIATSHPRWIVSALGQALRAHPPGDEAGASLRALLDADNAPARPVLVARPGRMSVEELRAIPGIAPGSWSPYSGILEEGRPEDLAAVRQGRAGVQDEGSQLVALALANAPIDGRDGSWVDLAAGPGGKAALLAALAEQRGAVLTAVEQHPHRAELVRRVVGAPHRVIVGDGREAIAPGSADRVLVDVPCTGLGALRRRPEARWRRSPADLATLGPLQRGLLDAALDAVRPGGVVAYTTCSPHVAETDLVVDDVLRRRGDAQWMDARTCVPGVPDLGDGPAVRLWPHVHGTDGMYLALLQRHLV